jgi:penicillin-binding protein 2
MKHDSRKYVILTFFILIGAIYVLKLFYMQVVDDHWKLRSQQITEQRREITPPRAIVYDRNGKMVISNNTHYNLMVCEAELEDFDIQAFSELIGWTPEQIRKRFVEIRDGEGTYKNPHTGQIDSNYQRIRSYPFIKELTANEMSKIAPHLDRFKGFYELETSMRSYPFGNAANILGYLNEVNKDDLSKYPFYKAGDYMGRSGIERYYDSYFRGQKGVKYIVQSARNNQIGSFENGA